MMKAAATARPTGFTLVEVMVAMVIGMIGIIIMMQVFATAEGQKRATTGTGDAQSNGAMALYELQRDVRQSGYGFNSMSLLTCPLKLLNATIPALGPVTINPLKDLKDPANFVLPPGDDKTDTLLVIYGSSGASPEGDAVSSRNDNKLAVQFAKGFVRDDAVIPAPASEGTTACTLTLTMDWVTTDPAGAWVTIGAAPDVASEMLFNVGPAPTIRAYAVRGGNLTVCDYMQNNCSDDAKKNDANIWRPIYSNIVSLQAEYGHNDTDPITWDDKVPTTACAWVRAPALRIAVVARNSQVEKLDEKTGLPVSPVAPSWAGGSFDLTKTVEPEGAWSNYRYKVFETVVPLRNLPWMARC